MFNGKAKEKKIRSTKDTSENMFCIGKEKLQERSKVLVRGMERKRTSVKGR